MAEIPVRCFFEPVTSTCTYVVHDPVTKRAAIVDPVLSIDVGSGHTCTKHIDSVLAHCRQHGLAVEWVLETHVHADHITSAPHVKEQCHGAKSGIGSKITVVQRTFAKLYNKADAAVDGRQFDRLFADGDVLSLGELTIKVLCTPGHTPACVSYLLLSGENRPLAVFTGDSIFSPPMGTARCDFPHGSPAQLWDSIQRLLELPEDVATFAGHDYPTAAKRELHYQSTVGEQKRSNIHIAGKTRDEFVELRSTRDQTLNAPGLLIIALQCNIEGGVLPPKESNGISYLKLPLNFPLATLAHP